MRRERFMMRPRSVFKRGIRRNGCWQLRHRSGEGQAKGKRLTASCGTRARRQPPKEKCDAKDRANEPNPPRVVLPDSDDGPGDELLDEESPPKRLLRRDHDALDTP
jgi:hypothetical protein